MSDNTHVEEQPYVGIRPAAEGTKRTVDKINNGGFGRPLEDDPLDADAVDTSSVSTTSLSDQPTEGELLSDETVQASSAAESPRPDSES